MTKEESSFFEKKEAKKLLFLRGFSRERGFALIAVLVCAIMLAVITGAVVSIASAGLHGSQGEEAFSRLGAAADAGIARALAALTGADASARPRLDGVAFSEDFAGVSVQVSVTDEAGKVDINFAPGPVLAKVLVGAGMDARAATVEADRVLDWRERGVLKRLNGAKDADYAAAGYAYGPREGLFHSVGELALVMGMEQVDLSRVEGSLTIYARQADIDPRLATAATLRLLGMALVPAESGGLALGGHVVTVAARATEGGFAVERRAVVRLTGNAARAFWVYRWA